MSTTKLIERITIDHRLKDFVPKEEVAAYIQRFLHQEECQSAKLYKLNRQPGDFEGLATCFAILELRCASGVSHKAFFCYANGDCPLPDYHSPHLRYLFSVTADEVRQNLPFLDKQAAFLASLDEPRLRYPASVSHKEKIRNAFRTGLKLLMRVIVGLASGHSKTSLILTLISLTLNTTGAYSRIGRIASNCWVYLRVASRRASD